MRGRHRLVVVGLALEACSGGAGSRDGGAGADAGFPTPPAAPVLTPCPTGWREELADGVTRCQPWAPGGAPSCAGDQVAFPGDTACRTIGSACPAGDWPEGLPAGSAIVYARSGATGGTGTPAAPYGKIGDALAGAAPGTIVALAKGTFDESVAVPAGVTLWGACVRDTKIAWSTTGASAVALDASGGALRNLQVAGPGPGIAIANGAAVDLKDVLIAGVFGVGLSIAGASQVTAHDLVVRDGQDGAGENAGVVVDTSRLEGDLISVTHNRTVGLIARGVAIVALRDVVVSDTQDDALPGQGGLGVAVGDRADLSLTRAVIENNLQVGVWTSYVAKRVALTDAVVRDTHEIPGGHQGGRGLDVEGGSHAEVSRTVFERNDEVGVMAYGNRITPFVPSDLVMSDVLVLDTHGIAAGTVGDGVLALLDAQLSITRGVIERSRSVGVYAGQAAMMTLSDVVIGDTRGEAADGRYGQGLAVVDGAHATVTRGRIERNHDLAAGAYQPGSVLSMSDVVVSATTPEECAATTCQGHGVAGVEAHTGGAVDVTRFVIDGSSGCGVQAIGADLELHHGVVSASAIGACLPPGFDLARVQDDVSYLDDDVNADLSGTLPEPDLSLHP